MVAKACVCSAVLTTTASMSRASSKSLRKSTYFRACGYFCAALLRLVSETSQSATMFSLDTLCRFDAPRPPAPMMAMLSFSLGDLPRGNAGAPSRKAPPAREADPRNPRRVIWRRMGEGDEGCFMPIDYARPPPRTRRFDGARTVRLDFPLWRGTRRKRVELVTLRRVAPRAAAQRWDPMARFRPLNVDMVVAAQQPPPVRKLEAPGRPAVRLIQLFHEEVRKLNRITMMLEGDAPSPGHAGQLRVLNHRLSVELHREPVAFHRNDETIP